MSDVDIPPAGQETPFLRAAIVAVVTDILSCAVLFGLPLSADQTTALLLAVNSGVALVFLVLSIRAHRRSTPLSAPRTVIDGVSVPLVPKFLPGSPQGSGASSVG